MPKINFNFPVTKSCIVVWYRNGERHETKISTPSNATELQTVMLKHRVGLSEIRAIKSDVDSQLTTLEGLNTIGLRNAMMMASW